MIAQPKSQEWQLVEAAGAEYIGIREKAVCFRDPQTQEVFEVQVSELTTSEVLRLLAERRLQAGAAHERPIPTVQESPAQAVNEPPKGNS